MAAETKAREADRTARQSPALAWAVRGGLVGYGALHLLVAWVAVRLILAPSSGTATGKGALAQLADDTAGRLSLAALALGFVVLVLWQLFTAAVGYRDREGWTRQLLRFGALCRAAVWGYLAAATTALTVGGRSASGKSPNSTTATVMSWPAGPWLVALAGAVLAGVGIGLAVFGWRRGFLRQLDEQARHENGRRVPIVVLGLVGYVTKGAAFVVIGVLLGWAAWTHDPQKSGGLDQALRELLGGFPGTVAVIVIATGLACFGLFLVGRAWHLDRESLTR